MSRWRWVRRRPMWSYQWWMVVLDLEARPAAWWDGAMLREALASCARHLVQIVDQKHGTLRTGSPFTALLWICKMRVTIIGDYGARQLLLPPRLHLHLSISKMRW